MGGVCSSDDIYDNPEVKPHKAEFEALQLRRREIKKLYELFKKVDLDNSGSIGLNELLNHMDVDKTAFTERVFSIFDEDGSGEVDFREFVLALWNYCTLGSTTLDVFAFDLYDKDCSGFLGLTEIEIMVHDIYGKHAKTNNHAKSIVANLKKMSKEMEINVEQFCVFCKNHQALLFPAFEMQLVLQNSTLGRYFWSRNAERRVQVSKGKFVPVRQFVELHISRNLRGHHKPSTAPTDDNAVILQSITGTKHDRQVKATLLKLEEEHGHKFTEVPVVKSDVTERLYATGHYEEALARANLHPSKPSKHDETLQKLSVQTTEEAAIEKAKILKTLKKKAGVKETRYHNNGGDDDGDEVGFEGSGRRHSFPTPHVSEKVSVHHPKHLNAVGHVIEQENAVIKAAYPLDKVLHKPKPAEKKDPHSGHHTGGGHGILPLKGSNDTMDELEANSIATNTTGGMGSPGKLPPLHHQPAGAPPAHPVEHVVHHRGARDEFDHLKGKKIPAIPRSTSHDEGGEVSHHSNGSGGGKKSVHLGASHDEADHHHHKAGGKKVGNISTVPEGGGSRNGSRSGTPERSHRVAAH